MKVHVTLKDPDSLYEAVEDAVKALPKPDGIDDKEWESLREDRAEAAREAITRLWMPYGEYLAVEFNTETGTATVLPGPAFR